MLTIVLLKMHQYQKNVKMHYFEIIPIWKPEGKGSIMTALRTTLVPPYLHVGPLKPPYGSPLNHLIWMSVDYKEAPKNYR